MKKTDAKNAVKWAGRILMLLSFTLIIIRLVRYDINFSALSSGHVISGLVLAVFLCGATVFCQAFNYRWLLCTLAKTDIDRKLSVNIYCSSNLYKYIPGNIMHLVGRNRLAVEVETLSHSQVAVATMIDSVFLMLAALLVSLACAMNFVIESMRQVRLPVLALIIAGAVLLILGIAALVFRERFAGFLTCGGRLT